MPEDFESDDYTRSERESDMVRKLYRIEARVGQLVRDYADFKNTVDNLKKSVRELEDYKLKVDTRAADIVWIAGAIITIGNILINLVFHFWK